MPNRLLKAIVAFEDEVGSAVCRLVDALPEDSSVTIPGEDAIVAEMVCLALARCGLDPDLLQVAREADWKAYEEGLP